MHHPLETSQHFLKRGPSGWIRIQAGGEELPHFRVHLVGDEVAQPQRRVLCVEEQVIATLKKSLLSPFLPLSPVILTRL